MALKFTFCFGFGQLSPVFEGTFTLGRISSSKRERFARGKCCVSTLKRARLLRNLLQCDQALS